MGQGHLLPNARGPVVGSAFWEREKGVSRFAPWLDLKLFRSFMLTAHRS